MNFTRRSFLGGALGQLSAPFAFGDVGKGHPLERIPVECDRFLSSSIQPTGPLQDVCTSLRLVRDLVDAARSQIGVTVGYDPAYRAMAYPMGDVPRRTGVCVDVVIRAYRDALGIDFQALIYEDMNRAFSAYPTLWGLTSTDRNIDHRRVPNLETYLARQGAERPATGWQAGDLVSMRLGGTLPHIGLVSDRLGYSGRPLILHNIGRGTREEDRLGQFEQERRFTFLPEPAHSASAL